MNYSAITVRYAKALFQLAKEEGKLKDIMSNIEGVVSIIEESPEFSELLENPVLKASDKSKIVLNIFEGKIEEVVIRFIQLLIQNKRETHLPEVCRYFNKLYKAEQGIQEALITTSQALDSATKDDIIKEISKKFGNNLEVKEEVNPGIIGGFKLRIEDKEIDASIATKLTKIKRELINS